MKFAYWCGVNAVRVEAETEEEAKKMILKKAIAYNKKVTEVAKSRRYSPASMYADIERAGMEMTIFEDS